MILGSSPAESLVGSRVFTLQLLGGFRLRADDDEEIRLTETAQRVLALVAVQAQSLRRVHAAGLLWPDVTHERSIGSLRSAVWSINRLDARLLSADRRSLRLGSCVAVDLHRARALAARLIDGSVITDDLGSAARELLSRDLLPGWYDDWSLLAGEEWRQTRTHALESMAANLLERARPGDAVLAALEAANAEPLRESAHLLVIRAYAAEGNASRALAHFTEFRLLLASTLGARPTARTVDLVNRLRAQITLD